MTSVKNFLIIIGLGMKITRSQIDNNLKAYIRYQIKTQYATVLLRDRERDRETDRQRQTNRQTVRQ